MNRLKAALERAHVEQRSALIVYLCAGDPDLDTTAELLLACAAAGADVIELGMPFSDPTADGPVIQRASERALRSGTTLRGVLALVERVRKHSQVAIALFGYYNPILAFGEAALAKAAKQAGVDGVMVVDLPPEQAEPLLSVLRPHGLSFIPFVAPTTPDARVQRIAAAADAFLYYVALTGVTGAAADLDQATRRAARIRELTGLPVAVGFGVKTAADATTAARADGVVVGSALCSIIERTARPELVPAVRAFVAELRAAMPRAASGARG